MENLLNKIAEKSATIGIIGLGYTGLSLAHDFGSEGFKIIGFDIDASKIETLKNKKSYLPFLPLGHLFHLLEEKHFIPTSNPADLLKADVKIISVPTPLNTERLPDISFLLKAVETAGSYLDEGQLIVIQSTSFPGTTEEEALPLLEKVSGKKVGRDFFLAYVPEREDAGNPNAVLSQIPRICGGITSACRKLVRRLYEQITVRVHACSSTRVAEAAKAFENAYRLINIAFVDEMKVAFDKMGINIWEVIEASSTKPFGYTPFYPGPGIGGECIPVDPVYLAWRAKQYAAPSSMIESAIEVNVKTSDYVVFRVGDALNQQAKSLKEAKILILGVAFKKDVGDIRESPALRIIPALQEKGAQVFYNDPYVPELKKFNLRSTPLEEGDLSSYDCLLVISDHSRYDWEWICEQARLIVDTRNATKKVPADLKKGKVLL
ncbi:MAG: nucleotide sugar dehydrogenase [Chlamydiales bacterium]|nr:nucleotide sugar dehydrogenase [Chlamydiales bacterium]